MDIMDIEQMVKNYDEFVLNLYTEIRSQCHCYGELRERIRRLRSDLRWEHGDTLGEKIESFFREEIDSVLETLPIPDIK